MDETPGLGLPKQAIEKLEAPLKSFTFDSVVGRLDEVFAKGWSYHFSGPELIHVPKQTPKNPQAKNPRAFHYTEVPHWQCLCAIEIIGPTQFNEICREYSVLIPAVEDGSFEVARDLAFIYTAHYGLGVGKRSKDLFLTETDKVELAVTEPNDVIDACKKELDSIKRKLGIGSLAELEPLITEWNPDLNSVQDITKSNLKGFVSFLRTKLGDEHARKPD